MGMTMTQKILAAHAGLPEVTAGQLIGSKFLAAAVWALIGGAVIFLAFCLTGSGLLVSGGEEAAEVLGEMTDAVGEVMRDYPGEVFLFLLFIVSGPVRTYFQITCAILFGASIVRKNKALVAVLMVLAVNFVVNLILSLFGVSGLFPALFGMMIGSPCPI